jgi:hypothetical protein
VAIIRANPRYLFPVIPLLYFTIILAEYHGSAMT